MYIIKGYDRRYGSKKRAECFGRFDNLRDCMTHMNSLKTGMVGSVMKFWYEEVHNDDTGIRKEAE